MSLFVDYHKRGVELPDGCKDLIDVLNKSRPAKKRNPTSQIDPPSESLADVERYLDRMFTSAASSKSLWIDGNHPALIGLFHNKWGLRALIMVDAAREQMVRTLFTDAGIAAIQDDALKPSGICSRGLMYPLALAAPAAQEIVRRLLTKGLGLPETVALRLRYREKDAT